jgi:hypothetical protein
VVLVAMEVAEPQKLAQLVDQVVVVELETVAQVLEVLELQIKDTLAALVGIGLVQTTTFNQAVEAVQEPPDRLGSQQ